MKTKKAKLDLHEVITNRFVEALEKGTNPWVKPWKSNGAGDAMTGGFPVNVAADLSPGAIDIAINTYLSGSVPVTVIVLSPDGDDAAIGTYGDAVAGKIIRVFTVNVATDLKDGN